MTSTDYAEHRTNIKFCVNLGKTPTQTQKMLETAKVRPPVCRSLVFKWHKRFRDGREDIEDDKGRGRKSTLTAASIKEVKDVIDRKSMLSTIQGENAKLEEICKTYNERIQELEEILNQKDQDIKEKNNTIAALENQCKMLSKTACGKLTFHNPNIADLSDGKRPTKLAEEFAELYDNEWTDAFENIQLESEPEKVAFMLRLLQCTRHICSDVSRRHMEDIKKSIFTLTVDTKKLSKTLSSEQNAIESCNKSQKVYVMSTRLALVKNKLS